MKKSPCLIYLFLLFLSSFPVPRVKADTTAVNIGVVLDLGTTEGKKSWTSISMAIEDFYTANPNHSTRIVLHARDSNQDIIGAASAALDLLQNAHVQAIIGARTSAQTEFLIDMGNKTQVPIISFLATSPSLSSSSMPYFVRTALKDSSQVAAIAAIVKSFGWRRVVPIYVDSDYGRGIIPYLVDAFQNIDVLIPYRSAIPDTATDYQIKAELYKLMTMQTRVFVVHMTTLGSKLFAIAAELGLMNEGYAWIITDGIANTLDSLDESRFEVMQGILGIRPYIAQSKLHNDFTLRWKARYRRDNPGTVPTESTVYNLWAYDTATALAMAVEKVGNFSTMSGNVKNSTDLASLGVSPSGSNLLEAIRNTKFHGVAGNFELVDGQLQSSAFEIVNINGTAASRIGFWSSVNSSLSRHLNSSKSITPKATNLKTIIWPGDSTSVPKGWQVPTNEKKLRIGVPIKSVFKQFVNVERDSVTNITTVTGFCIDVFEAVLQKMPYSVSYDYIPVDGVSRKAYDKMISKVHLGELDAVVGDIIILENRARYVDFSLPYSYSGVSLLVKGQRSKKAWVVFLKPLTKDLWLGSLAFFLFTGFVVWVLEHRINDEYRGPPSQQLGLVYYFAFSTLVFAHKDKLVSNLSRIAVIIWVFVVLILTNSYTASLASLLTVQQLKPTITNLTDLTKNGDSIGYQDGSFVGDLLKLMNYTKHVNLITPEDYANALINGSRKGGVSAIADEVPYLKVFLSDHCADYTMVEWTYKADGFGFVFQRGSLLVPDISRAILKVIEGDIMTQIERKWFGDPLSCPPQSDSFLDFNDFAGLFLVTGLVSSLALLIFFANFIYREWKELSAVGAAAGSSLSGRIKAWAMHFDSKDKKFDTSVEKEKENGEGVIIVDDNADDPDVPALHGEGWQSPYSNFSDVNLGPPDEALDTATATPGMESPLPEASSTIEMSVLSQE